jgi:NAD(P)-dependent dehydrogenase (short-subunit alcohol dehydrogenase family)
MTDHRQHPFASGFTKASTADEVLARVDLTGKNVIITGGSGRLGLETTRALRCAGATVTVTARDPARATAAVAHLQGVEVSELDLLDPASIERFADHWLDSGRPLHILINTAASPLHAQVIRDARGYEAQFATDHLGHFQLTVGLLPALRAAHGARVVNLSSGAQRLSDIRWEDVHFTSGYDAGTAYAQAKTANVLFAVELDRRWAAYGIRGYAVHPGVIVNATPIGSEGYDQLRAQGLIDESGQPIIRPETGRKTPQQGAATIAFAAASPSLANVGGVYLKDSDISPLVAEELPMTFDPDQDIPAEVAPHAINPQSAQRLWELSEQLLTR